jgi:hypothetical protein
MPAGSVTAAASRQERSAGWQLPSGKQGVALHEGAALLFGLDGTLVDSVYEHVLAWREALEEAGIELTVWRINRRIGMSGGLDSSPRPAGEC